MTTADTTITVGQKCCEANISVVHDRSHEKKPDRRRWVGEDRTVVTEYGNACEDETARQRAWKSKKLVDLVAKSGSPPHPPRGRTRNSFLGIERGSVGWRSICPRPLKTRAWVIRA